MAKMELERPAEAHKLRGTLVAQGALLPEAQMAVRLGMTPTALVDTCRRYRLFAVDVENCAYYPAFLADPEIDRADLGDVIERLAGVSGWGMYVFFTTPKSSLAGQTPLAALRAGQKTEAELAAVGAATR